MADLFLIVSLICSCSVLVLACAASALYSEWKLSCVRKHLKLENTSFVSSDTNRIDTTGTLYRFGDSVKSLLSSFSVNGMGNMKRISIAGMAGLLAVLTTRYLPSFILPFLFVFIVLGKLEKSRERRFKQELLLNIARMVQSILIALRGGKSVQQAIGFTAERTDGKLGLELSKAYFRMETGTDTQEALSKLGAKFHNEDLDLLLEVISVNQHTGANVVPALENMLKVLNIRREQALELASLTSQGRLSGNIISMMPFVYLTIISIFSCNSVKALFGTGQGLTVLFTALLLNAAGYAITERIVSSVDASAASPKSIRTRWLA